MKSTKGISKRRIKNIFIYLILVFSSIVMIYPFAWMSSTSLKEYSYMLEFPPDLIPENPTFKNYINAWTSNNFQSYFLNSLFVTVIAVFLTILCSSLMAYAFARFDFWGKEIIFYSILIVLMIPTMVALIPQFLLAKTLNLRDSLWGLILFYTAGSIPNTTFLLRGFFEEIPFELEDAMKIDGAGPLAIFKRLILPLSKPALSTVTIFNFLGFWDEFTLALTFIDDPSKRTLPIAIATFQGRHGSDWGLVFAASIISIIPVVIVYVLMQRNFVGGITQGALKGR